MVEVLYTKAAAKDLLDLPAIVKARVGDEIEKLRGYPNVAGIKALKGEHKGEFRVRIGDYRIRFVVAGQTLTIVAIRHRREVY